MDHLFKVMRQRTWFTCALLDHLVVPDELVLDATLVQDCERRQHIQLQKQIFNIFFRLQRVGKNMWEIIIVKPCPQSLKFILPRDSCHLFPTQHCVSSPHPWKVRHLGCQGREGTLCRLISGHHLRQCLWTAWDSWLVECLWDEELVYPPSSEMIRLTRTPALYHYSPK